MLIYRLKSSFDYYFSLLYEKFSIVIIRIKMMHQNRFTVSRRPVVIIQKPLNKMGESKDREFEKINDIGHFSRGMWYNVAWSFAFIICLILCTYQTVNRVNLYFDNPITTVVKILRNSTFLYPIITICGSVQGGTSEIEEYLLKTGWNCIKPIDKEFWVPLVANFSQFWNMANISKDLSYRGKLIATNGETVYVKTEQLSTIFGQCVSLSIDVPVKPNPPSVYTLDISRPVVNKKCSEEIKLLIHTDRNYAKSLFLETLSLRLPHTVSARLVLSAKQFKLLNSSTHPCYDESEIAKCFHACTFKDISNDSICRFPFMDSIPMLNHLPNCSDAKTISTTYTFMIERFRKTNPDVCKCGNICNEIIYTSFLFIDDKLENNSKINIQVGDTNIESVEQVPSYDLISLLCDIGGNLSLYIGVCLLSVLDGIEYFGKVISKSACFNRRNKVKNSRTTVKY